MVIYIYDFAMKMLQLCAMGNKVHQGLHLLRKDFYWTNEQPCK